jgi:hypothetical protein
MGFEGDGESFGCSSACRNRDKPFASGPIMDFFGHLGMSERFSSTFADWSTANSNGLEPDPVGVRTDPSPSGDSNIRGPVSAPDELSLLLTAFANATWQSGRSGEVRDVISCPETRGFSPTRSGKTRTNRDA